jgi:hypothetical protein
MATHPQIRALAADLESATARMRGLIGSTDEAGLHRRPADGGWSAAECIAHLNLTTAAYLPLLDEALARAREMGGGMPRTLRRDLVGWLIWKSSSPSGRVKVKTTPRVVPTADGAAAELAAEFERLQNELSARLEAADGLPIHRIKVESVFDPRARYSLYSVFTILPAHQHRHLLQAERAVGSG